MAYTDPFIRLTFGGTIYNGADIWSCGINFWNTSSPVPQLPTTAEMQEFADLASENLSDWMSRTASLIGINAQLEWVKVAHLGTDGLYLKDSVITEVTPPVTGQGYANVPPQISTVISLGTNSTRGLAHIGRIYPPLSGGITANGYIATNLVQGMAESASTLIEDLNESSIQLSGAFAASVMSKVGAGRSLPITKIRVGNVLDTQRSRRNAFIETYEEVPVVLAG